MEGISIWHWGVVILVAGIFGYPVVRILRRAGLSGWWSILVFLPLFNVVALWIFAYARWPAVDSKGSI
jgi:hypothetical protein